MGNTNSSTQAPNVAAPSATHQKKDISACPMHAENTKKEDPTPQCPVKHDDKAKPYKNPSVYNVYSQKIDPRNQMPQNLDKATSPSGASLSTERVKSSIPKGGTDTETWTYPSPQMFWNALVRKGKTEGASEKDMDVVISVHNSMNEMTWTQVLEWEKLHPVKGEGREPKLLRFLGRPDELSPKARLKTLFGHPPPFDRHDWVVDRGGQEVRYVIDYYHDESAVSLDKQPQNMTDLSSIRSILVDVRPALDSPIALFDRLFSMPLMQLQGKTGYRPAPFFPSIRMVDAEKQKIAKLNEFWTLIQTRCEQQKMKLHTCKTKQECGAASVALQLCTGSVVCPIVAKEFNECVGAKPQKLEKVGEAYANLTKCLELFEADSVKLLTKDPSVLNRSIDKK